ncbi:hypothetical protein Pint_18412 [Pistacia integerrima]|uniref:Uncharacterized protein n=1 Tax=Pistacia integerrima TaxID=434235 RepID=A0ACC0YWK6_9ROSI|nr:hypothetical protein Pint_18412 [Pistacia integerrima]
MGEEETPNQNSYGNSSIYNFATTDFEAAAREAVLREQEISTQKIIQSHREEGVVGVASKDGTDILADRCDPSALKEHLLKMDLGTSCRNGIKAWEACNIEIGNGYGVPGGGAYYNAPRPTRSLAVGSDEMVPKNSELDRESEQKPVTKELPEYLKQRLRARGILKDDSNNGDPVNNNAKAQWWLIQKLETYSAQPVDKGKLPPGWVEAKDPNSGASYYYNESTGKSQWERPGETVSVSQSQLVVPVLGDWVEAVDETSGQKYYYNTKTHVSQWDHPGSSQPVTSQHTDNAVSRNAANGIWDNQSPELEKCMHCGGWGVGLVQMWGYCNHCTR